MHNGWIFCPFYCIRKHISWCRTENLILFSESVHILCGFLFQLRCFVAIQTPVGSMGGEDADAKRCCDVGRLERVFVDRQCGKLRKPRKSERITFCPLNFPF